MKTLNFFLTLLILSFSVSVLAQKTKTVDPDILPALPDGPPKPASKSEVSKARIELKGSCVLSLKKGEGLAAQVKIKDTKKISSICECIAREIAKGANLEEMDVVTTFYRGFDDKMKNEDGFNIYLHEAGKLEENCRLDSNYKVGNPEPRMKGSGG